MAEQTLKEKTAKGLFWGGVSNGVQQLLGVFIGIVLLKNLTPDDYGMVGMLAIFTAIASTIQESGFTAALTNRPEFKSEDYNAVFWFNLIVGSIIYVVLFFSAPFIALFFKQPELELLSRVLFLSILIGSFGIAHNAVLFRKLMVKERAKVDIFSIAIAGTVGIYMAVNGFGYWALVIQTLVYSFFGTILRWVFSPWRPDFSISFTPIKEMIGFSSKLLLSYIVNTVQSQLFSILLGRYYTTAILGYYSQGTKWGTMGMQVIHGMIFNVTQPMISQIRENKERQLLVFRKLLRFISFVSCPLLLGLAFISKEFISIVNMDFLPAVPIMQIYCCVALVSTVQYGYSQVYIALGRSDFYIYATLIYAIIQVVISIVIFPFGIYWLAFSVLLVCFANLLIWHCFFSKILNMKFLYLLKDVLPYFVVTLITFSVVNVITIAIESLYFLLISKIILSVILYTIFLWKSNSVIFREMLFYVFKGRVN